MDKLTMKKRNVRLSGMVLLCLTSCTKNSGVRNSLPSENETVSLPTLLKQVLFMQENAHLLSFFPITTLFMHPTKIVLNDLDMENMTTNAERYVDMVMTYAQNSLAKLHKIIFRSIPQMDGKENSTLKKLISIHLESFTRYNWFMKYEFQIANTHDLIFTNNNLITKTKSISANSQQMVKTDQFANTHNKIPCYFLQITHVDDISFRIEIIADKVHDKRRRLFIKELNPNNMTSSPNIETIIKINKQQISTHKDIDIDDEHAKMYQLALYSSKTETKPLPNATQIKLEIMKDENEFPPENQNYVPNCIDLSTVFKVKCTKTEKINIYWTIPTKSFGEISYRIINTIQKY
eukprot:171925_1